MPGSGAPSPDGSAGPVERDGGRLWMAALAVLAAGILFHGVRALVTGWLPSADDAYWSIMARSVFSSHPPLLGSSSSGGLTSGTGFHHVGPLGFYLLAPFVVVLGGVGVAVGSAVINAACAVLAGVSVRVASGVRAGWFALVGSALLAYVMGSELLVDPWNPHLATFPLWLGLCCTWAVLVGRHRWAAIGLVGLSLALQTHLSFVPVAAVLAVVIAVAMVHWCRRSEDRSWAPLWWALGATFVVNLPVLVQQFFAAGPGNLTGILEGSGDQGESIGVTAGLGLASQPLLQVWNWLPGTWSAQVVPPENMASPVVLLITLVLLGALLVLAVRRRAAERIVVVGLAAGLLVVTAVVATTLPFRIFGAPMSLARWIWPVGLFVQIVALDAALDHRLGLRRAGEATRRWPAVLGCGLVVLLTALNLSARDEGSGAVVQHHDEIRKVIELAEDELADLEHPLVPISSDILANPLGNTAVALLDWFDQRGIAFSVDDPVSLRQAGAHHDVDGTETDTVLVRAGARILDELPPGFRTIAELDPLTPDQTRWYLRQRQEVEERLPDFMRRLDSDPAFRDDVGVPEQLPPGTDVGWRQLLCGSFVPLPEGNVDTQRELITDEDRERLCQLDRELMDGAVTISVGPPPQR